MMKSILNDAWLYRRLITMQIRSQLQYKMNVLMDIVSYFAVTSGEFLAIVLYFGPFPTLLGWKVGEVALLCGVMSISFGFAEMLGAGIDNFADTVRLGEFDRVLLRPAGAFTQVIGSDFRLRRLGRISEGCGIILLALHLLPGLQWSVTKVVVLLIGIFSGSIIFLSVMLLGATICFWTIETTELLNMLTYGGREMLSYPLTIYNTVMQRIFLFIVPLAFGSYVPTCYVLGRPLPFGIPAEIAFVAPLIACAFAFISGCIWRFGVRRYQSTGS